MKDWLLSLFKDVTAQGAHVKTAIGNSGRKRRAAQQSQGDGGMDDGAGGIAGEGDNIVSGSDFDKADKALVFKIDEDLGLVFGFAIICKRNGEPYYDLQDDHITEKAMLSASTEFMQNSRISKDMHDAEDGTVVFSFPLTTDIAKKLDITTKQTGLLIAMKPSSDVLAKFKDGTYTGFSIGGSRIKDEEVDA